VARGSTAQYRVELCTSSQLSNKSPDDDDDDDIQGFVLWRLLTVIVFNKCLDAVAGENCHKEQYTLRSVATEIPINHCDVRYMPPSI